MPWLSTTAIATFQLFFFASAAAATATFFAASRLIAWPYDGRGRHHERGEGKADLVSNGHRFLLICGLGGHSILTLASFTTFAHFAFSSRMNVAKSPGADVRTSAPCLARFSRISAVPTMRAISPLSLATISGGVPAGAITPCHDP